MVQESSLHFLDPKILQNAATLHISELQIEDEAKYYCVILKNSVSHGDTGKGRSRYKLYVLIRSFDRGHTEAARKEAGRYIEQCLG